ncbi:hypothetical protein HPB50_025660 [Hyalomma asiaticum]|uniref:Uncharacterized protein n=1 Tax=Hyalomma asiaticum TaxID=266040 RepID=A0ACB7S8R8_HYAAI|nr:hypothetical protein HPB50_025660 [Hyalomma asiaticum]
MIGFESIGKLRRTAKDISYFLAHNKTATTFYLTSMTPFLFSKFVSPFSKGMWQNKFIVDFKLGRVMSCSDESFTVCEAVRRNKAALNRAVDFVLEHKADRNSAEAFELFSKTPLVLSRVVGLTGKTEAEVLLDIVSATNFLIDNYLIITGVVQSSVECHPAEGTQADALNKDCWRAINYLLNDWTMIASTSFPGEYILTGAWFHNGNKIGLNMEKKDSVLYLEKYTHVRFGPSVRQVGGKPSEGCIAVTSSGLVCVVILQSDETVITGTEILGLYRSRLKVVDLCYGKNGDFLVVTSDGLVQSSVHCFRIALKLNQDKCIITCHPFSSFFLNCHATAQPREKPPHTRVTHLNFVLREAADAVAVSVSGSAGSTIELWELREKPVRFHKMFHTPAVDTVTKTVGWQHHGSTTYTSPVMALCTPRLSIYDMSPPPSYIIAAYKDNVIKCFSREFMNTLCCININAASHRRDDHGIKYQHLSATVSHMQLSWTSSVMVAIDSLSQLYLFRLAPVTEPSTPVSPSYTLTLLEHCLMTGTDWWDVLLSMRPAVMGSREVISNLDKVLLHLETKEFSVEPLILQSLQQLTQWVADLALYLMASLPQQVYNNMRFPGGGLISDAKSLNMLRELLVIFRMWGFISESCLPAYTKMTGTTSQLGWKEYSCTLLKS